MNWYKINKTGLELGGRPGETSRDAFHACIPHSFVWVEVQSHAAYVDIDRLMENKKSNFPQVYAELLGLPEGLREPVSEVFAWNFRGEIRANTYDGCTTAYGEGGSLK